MYLCFVHNQPWSTIFLSLFDHMQTVNSYILSMHSQVLLYQDHQTPFSIRLKLKYM